MKEALDIQVKGIVQGVGFRPFVYRLAKKYLIDGWVLNATDGVFIHAEGETKLLDEFVIELSENPPAASQVDEVSLKEAPLEDFDSFDIRFSDAGAVEKTTLVSPDLATCDDCARELFNPNDRRYRYPFINCTNCGPRFTIIEKLPYDRKSTSMKDFPMCERCAREYGDPLDRRFHAQPDACFECGPHVSWREHEGMPELRTDVSRETREANAEDARVAASSERGANASGKVDAEGAIAAAGAQVSEGADVAASASSDAIDAPLGPVSWGNTRQESDAIFARAVDLLLAGKILAVKGLGGFHLVCDAQNPEAVALLRARKRREGKAFAVMMENVDAVREVCEVGEAEEGILAATQRPIVLLRKRADASFAPGLADKLPELGVMLPYTPVQHLLLHDFAEAVARRRRKDGANQRDGGPASLAGRLEALGSGDNDGSSVLPHGPESASLRRGDPSAPAMLVMTSGNIHDEPIVIDDEDAYEKLFDVADAFLGHDRAIRARYDDSVVRVIRAGSAGDAVQFIRRARGYAPLPLAMPPACHPEQAESPSCHPDRPESPSCHPERAERVEGSPTSQDPSTPASADASARDGKTPSIFATGPEQKNTFALTRDAEAFVSQHIGDMENAETYDAWLQAKSRYETLFEIEPTLIACDRHPEYLTSKWAHEQERDAGLPVIEVQHHQAHIAAVLGEHKLAGPVCGIAFDGTGYGEDGAIWGGEVLLSNLQAFERFANFAYVPMPGGAAAVKHPLRMAYGVLWAFDLLDHPGAAAALAALGPQAGICEQMIEQGINTPMTSSVGRLFDAASALLGVCVEPAYEGEPAILLEAALSQPERGAQRGVEGSRAASAEGALDLAASEGCFDSAASCGFAWDDEGATAANAAAERYAVAVVKNTATESSTAQDTSVVLFDAAPTFAALLDDLAAGVAVPVIARRFHDAFVEAVVMAAELVRNVYGIDVVALSGGVFMNRYLVEHALAALEAAGFTVAVNRDLPPNDGCISFGQAVVAWATSNEDEQATA